LFMKKITKKRTRDFLKSQFIMQLASSSKKNMPQVSIMLYVIDRDLNFYCATHSDSIKAQNMAENKNVSIAVWAHNQFMVQVKGIVETVVDEKKQNKILTALAKAGAKDDNFWPPVFRIKGSSYVLYKIVPAEISVLDLVSRNISESQSPFTKIL